MSNILIVGDDGPHSHGLQVLRELAARNWKDSPITVLSTAKEQMGRSFSLAPPYKIEQHLLNVTEVGPEHYTINGFPADLIYLAFMHPKRFLRRGTFDVVLSGINLGPNVGWDVMHSGTVAAALLAASQFRAFAMAFSQDVDLNITNMDPTMWPAPGSVSEKEMYGCAERYLAMILKETPVVPGECVNVNFPATDGGYSQGIVSAPVAGYSKWQDRRDPILPIHDRLNDDVQKLAQGFVTTSMLELNVNPSIR